jgi:hypothetical protein
MPSSAREAIANDRGIGVLRFQIASVLAFSLMLPVLPASSAEIPVLNVVPLCRGIINQGADPLQAGEGTVTLKQCLAAEQGDRETMIKEWSTFSEVDKKHCTAEATMGGESSYTDLVTCLEMARDVKKLKSSPAGTRRID